MANDLHPTGCIADGEDLQRTDLSIHLVCTRGLDELVEVRGTDTVIPGLAGRRPRNRVPDRLQIELTGIVQGALSEVSDADRLESFRTAVKFMRTLFAADRDPFLLEIPLEDGTTARTVVRPLALVWGEPPLPGVQEVSVSLESIQPDWAYGS